MRGGPAGRRWLRLPGAAAALAVRGYQRAVSPLVPARCRFYPSCSSYAVEALRRHGLAKGAALSLWRLARCQPFHPGGVDHVPPAGSWRAPAGSQTGRAGRAAARKVTHGLA
ncbi:MAG: membrane protein insertion efficiency factor YidD [Bifidobacteriaceae bacterium]|nr:membrane protein insertion efficiency factor YidD [Bifidobacteriaceae bacterium]